MGIKEILKRNFDKVQHMAVNAVSVLVGTICGTPFVDERTACCIAIAICLGLSIGKEYGDKRATGNHWCWWDLLADIIGIILGALLFKLLSYGVYELVLLTIKH